MFGNPRTAIIHVIAETLLRDMVKSDIPHSPTEFATELWNYVDAVDAEADRRIEARAQDKQEKAQAAAAAANDPTRPIPGDTCECPACIVRRGIFGGDPTADLEKATPKGKH
jgi:hypothetical protein